MKKKIEKLKESSKLQLLRRKLFIAAAYLLVVTGLLAYVSYGQYRIKIDGEIHMPTSAMFEAGIVLAPNETDARGWDASSQQILLAGLMPGEAAADYATAGGAPKTETEEPAEGDGDGEGDGDAAEPTAAEIKASSRRMELTVRNWYTHEAGEEGGEETTIIADSPIRFSIKVNGTGCLPLEFILVDEDNNKYTSTCTVGENGERSYTFVTDSATGKEAEFTVDGREKGEDDKWKLNEDGSYCWSKAESKFYIYVGWQTGAAAESGDYRKEVERLEIRTVISSTDVGHDIMDKETVKTTLEATKPAEGAASE